MFLLLYHNQRAMALRESSVLHTKTSENMTKCESSTFTISNSQMSQYDVHVHKMPRITGNPATPPPLRLITTMTNFVQIYQGFTVQGPVV